jgi:pyruvate/2-oxoglutarate/acetoin dehydrogenase E1 component
MPSLTYLEAVRQALADEMQRDERVIVLGEDIGAYGGAFGVTRGLLERFGEGRVIDTPVSESAIVGAGIGAAMMGLRPVVELQYIDFLSCAFDQIVNCAAKMRYRSGMGVPLVVRGPCGAGLHAGPFHSQHPEGTLLNVPGLKIVAPATPADAKGLLLAAMRDPDPVIVLEHKLLYRSVRESVPAGDALVPIGKARIERHGKHVSIVTYAAMVYVALEAAAIVAEQDGIETEVLDLRSLAPMDDAAILASVSRTGKLLVLHEASRTGGAGAEIAALAAERAFEHLDAPIVRLAAPDTPVPLAPVLEASYLPNAERTVKAIRALHAY